MNIVLRHRAALSRVARTPLTGILLLILSTWALSGLDASGKWVMQIGVPLLILCWFRYVGHLLLTLMLVLPARGTRALKCHSPRNQILRGLFMLGSTLSFFAALRYLPQAEATAILFVAPLLVLALAPLLLGEPMRRSRWLAAVAGFTGVLIVVRPGSGLSLIGTTFALLAALGTTGQYVVNRLVAVDDSMTTLAWSGAVGSIILTLLMPFVFSDTLQVLRALPPLGWTVLMCTGLLGALGHVLQIQAYHSAPASVLAPFLYAEIVSASTFGWLIWGQFPDAMAWFGISIIVISGILITRHEWRHRRQNAPAGTAKR